MRRAGRLLITLLAASTLLAGNSAAGTLEEILDRGNVRVGIEPGYMPFGMLDKQGQIVGFDVDLAGRMAAAMGVKLELVESDWQEILSNLQAGKFDIVMSGMTLTQERNLRVNFADPYIVVGQTILLRKSLAEVVKSYRDLNDPKYTVVSKAGTTGEQAARRLIPKATFRAFPTEQQGVAEVAEGKADAFIFDAPYCAVASAHTGGDKLVFLDQPCTYEPLAWAVRKGDYDFVNWLNHFLRQIQNDGTYAQAYHRWFKDDAWLKSLQ